MFRSYMYVTGLFQLCALLVSLIWPQLEVVTRLYSKETTGIRLVGNVRGCVMDHTWLPLLVQQKIPQWRHSLHQSFQVCANMNAIVQYPVIFIILCGRELPYLCVIFSCIGPTHKSVRMPVLYHDTHSFKSNSSRQWEELLSLSSWPTVLLLRIFMTSTALL